MHELSDSWAALFVLACTFGGALIGMRVGRALPEHHLADKSRDTVKVAMGLISTITALILGLVTASAKGDFDDDDAEVRRGAADVLVLDRVLARYGPETAEIRELLRGYVVARLESSWPEEGSHGAAADEFETMRGLERTVDRIGALAPGTDDRRSLKAQAFDLGSDMIATRWHILEGDRRRLPRPFLVILACWLTLIFSSFGLLAPRNATTVGVIFVCALSVAAAVFLILEMAAPFDGLMKISSGPLRYALAHLGR